MWRVETSENRSAFVFQFIFNAILKIHDRMAMLRREILTLSMLADRFIFPRKISVASLSSQTLDMASNWHENKIKKIITMMTHVL